MMEHLKPAQAPPRYRNRRPVFPLVTEGLHRLHKLLRGPKVCGLTPPQPLLGSVDNSTQAIMQEFPETMAGLGGSQALQSPVSSVESSGPGTTSTQAGRINEADVQGKLSGSGHPHERLEVRSDEDPHLVEQTWVQELDSHLARISAESLHQHAEWSRYSTLRRACAFSDTFFVVLHRQFYQ